MKSYQRAIAAAILALSTITPVSMHAAPCSFDSSKDCTLFRDILNGKDAAGLAYYGPTNYDHRISGEINVFDSKLVQSYSDCTNTPGQIKLITYRVNSGLFKSGEIMTRIGLDQPPYNSPVKIHPFTTKDLSHGYIEETLKMPKCEFSDDGLCQAGLNPDTYNRGMWPSIWMLPTHDTDWPTNGEIDIVEAYKKSLPLSEGTVALHFNGGDARCGNGDCKFIGYLLPSAKTNGPLFNDFHTWGFEWQPDPNSSQGGVIMTGYFDNVKLWGPLATDSLPADGPAGMGRGFNDPAGGFYLITALAMGGPYAGAPNSHLLGASMYIQSIKAYSVDGGTPPPPPPINECKPPINIQSMTTPDKKQVTIAWQDPLNSDPVLNYQVNNSENKVLWKGTSKSQHCFLEGTLPGTPGTFTYFLYSHCSTGMSDPVKYVVTIN